MYTVRSRNRLLYKISNETEIKDFSVRHENVFYVINSNYEICEKHKINEI